MKHLFTLLFILVLGTGINAQNPYEDLKEKPKVRTLTGTVGVFSDSLMDTYFTNSRFDLYDHSEQRQISGNVNTTTIEIAGVENTTTTIRYDDGSLIILDVNNSATTDCFYPENKPEFNFSPVVNEYTPALKIVLPHQQQNSNTTIKFDQCAEYNRLKKSMGFSSSYYERLCN